MLIICSSSQDGIYLQLYNNLCMALVVTLQQMERSHEYDIL